MLHANDPKRWSTLATHTAYQDRWVTVAIDEVSLPNDRRYEYTRSEPAGIGVAVLGFNDAGEVLLEREYRHGVGEVIWQLPGGSAAAHEDLQNAGLRELMEETGYTPAQVTPETVRYLGVIWDNPAFGLAQSHVYGVWGLIPAGSIRRDPAEFVTLHWRPVEWLKEAVRNGAIKERVVVAATAYLLLNGWDQPARF